MTLGWEDFLSVDPITKKYPELTPYQFASNRPIDGIDEDGLEFAKYNREYKYTIIIPKNRDGFIESQYKYAMQAKMNVLVAGTLKEMNTYLQQKGTKYDGILFGGHGGWGTSSVTLGDYGYKLEDLNKYSTDFKNLGSFINKNGFATLLGCFQSTPQYSEQNVLDANGSSTNINMNGEPLVKKLSSLTDRKVIANRAATRISYKMFSGFLPQSVTLEQGKEHPYANLNNKFAGAMEFNLSKR